MCMHKYFRTLCFLNCSEILIVTNKYWYFSSASERICHLKNWHDAWSTTLWKKITQMFIGSIKGNAWCFSALSRIAVWSATCYDHHTKIKWKSFHRGTPSFQTREKPKLSILNAKKEYHPKKWRGDVNICALFSFHRRIGVHDTFQSTLIET